MSVRKDEVQLTVIINGSPAKKELALLDQEAYELKEKMKGLKKGTEEYIAASQRLSQINGRMSELRKGIGLNSLTLRQLQAEMRKLTTIQKDLTPGTKAFRENAEQIAAVRDRIGQVRSGLGPFGQAWKSFGAILKTNPLLTLATVLLAIYEAFKQNNTIMQIFERITKVIGTALGVFMDRVVDTGKALINAFSQPKKLMQDLAEFVKTNLINRFKAFGVILDGILSLDFKKTANGALQLSTGVENVIDKAGAAAKSIVDIAKAQDAITQAFQKLRDEERALNLENIKRAGQRELEISKSKDLNLTIQQRQEALKKANDLEIQMSAETLDLQERKLKLMQQESEFVEDNEEDRQKLAEQEAVVAQLRVDNELKLQEIKNKGSKLDVKEDKEADQREARRIASAEKLAELEQRLLDVKRALYEQNQSEQQREISQANAKYEELIKLAEGNADKIIEIVELREQEIAGINARYAAQELKSKEDFQREIDLLTMSEADREIFETKAKWDALIKQAEQYGLDTTGLYAAMYAELDIIRQRNTLNELDQNKSKNDQLVAQDKAVLDAKQNMLGEFSGLIGELLGFIGAKQGEYTAFEKALAFTQILIDTAKSISSVVAGATQAAEAGGPAYPFLLAGYVASGIATVLGAIANAKAVLSQAEVPAYAKGTEYVNGPGTSTSDSIYARLSKGERVVDAATNAQLGGIPNAMLPKLLYPDINRAANSVRGSGSENSKAMQSKFNELINCVKSLEETVARKQDVLRATMSFSGRDGFEQKQADYEVLKELSGR